MNSGIELKNTLACLTFIFLGARLFKNCLLGGGGGYGVLILNWRG